MLAVKWKQIRMVKLLLQRSDIDCDEKTLNFAQDERTATEIEKLIKEHIRIRQSKLKMK